MRTIKRLLIIIIILGHSVVAEDLESFLAPLQHHASISTIDARIAALEAQRQATLSPFSIDASAAYNRFFNSGNLDVPLELPQNASQVNLTATLRPIIYGDLEDAISQLDIDLARLQLTRKNLLTQLESQAIETALNVILAQQAEQLALEGLNLAGEVLIITERRALRGAATAREIREAEEGLREAEASLQDSQDSLLLAELSLTSLVGQNRLESQPDLALPSGIPADLQSAELDLLSAQLNLASATRELYPVAQASYTWNVDDNSSITASLESRTLQPSVGYSFQDPARSSPESLIDSSFQIGVALTYSPALFDAIRIVEKNIEAAEENLEAVRNRVLLQEQQTLNNLASAERRVLPALQDVADRLVSLEETETRLDLGLTTALEQQQAWFSYYQAELAVQQAELAILQGKLALYQLYSLPPSEVLP